MSANRIYFAQHGLATSKEEDPKRPLSSVGIKQTHAVASQLLSSKTGISQVFHSGKLRAEQTAEIFSSVLKLSPIQQTDGLSPNDEITLILEKLTQEDALYVGHLPHLDKLLSYLVTGDVSPSILQFKNSAVVCLRRVDVQYFIDSYLTPDLIAL